MSRLQLERLLQSALETMVPRSPPSFRSTLSPDTLSSTLGPAFARALRPWTASELVRLSNDDTMLLDVDMGRV